MPPLPASLTTIDLGPSPLPLPTRIARHVIAEVRRGSLSPGLRLPGTRPLAEALGVHRNTVVAAYEQLVAEGWAEARQGGGTFVSAQVGQVRRGAALREGPLYRVLAPAYEAPRHTFARGTLVLAGGVPALDLVPAEAIGRAYRRALRSRASRGAWGYGDSAGHPALRACIAASLRERRGVAASEGSVLVTRGSQMALELASRVLLSPGDAIAVEDPGYPPAWSSFAARGARLVPVPVDGEGVVVEALARAIDRHPIRAIYVTPQHQYPTTVTLSPARRVALLSLCRARRVAIIEDDYDHEFAYEGAPTLPLAAHDDGGVVLYVGTLSKTLAPALRIGFVAGPPSLIERLASERVAVDRQGDAVLEAAVAELFDEGVVDRHVRKMRAVYAERRDALVAALEGSLGERVSLAVPSGGMALWLSLEGGVDACEVAREAEARRVGVVSGRHFMLPARRSSHLRVGFACADPRALARAARALCDAVAAARR